MKLRRKIYLSRTSLEFTETMAQRSQKVSQVQSLSGFQKDPQRCSTDSTKISIDSNLVRTDFLNVELDLCNDTYAPQRKPNFRTTYVNIQSNHPLYVINQVPKSIYKRLTTLSKNKRSFNRAKKHYQEALVKGGHKHDLKYNAGNG